MQSLWLKKHQEKRILHGHLWVFSNEIDSDKSPLQTFEPGENAVLRDCHGTSLGTVTVNPNTLICARLHSRKPDVPLDEKIILARLKAADALRVQSFTSPWYRLCHGEGDLLPVLVVDRYNNHITVQITTCAMEQRKEIVLACLEQLFHPTSILFANDLPARALENLSQTAESVGPVPAEIEVQENRLGFTVPLLAGQKTGWFYDQRTNRLLAGQLAINRSVLDAFCYAGGFGVNCKAHAREVTFLDSSERALAFAKRNFEQNKTSKCRGEYLRGDAFNELDKLYTSGRRFGLISIDPPALIKRRKDTPKGIAAYRRLNHLAVRLLEPDGILISSSCSFHLQTETLVDAISRAAQKQHKSVQILAMGRQDIDHPELLGMPETSYLKCCFAKISGQQ